MPTKPTIPSVWASDPSAVIATPPSALQLLGWAVGEQPTAANVNWKFNEIDQWITFVDPYIGSTDGDLFANSIRPYSDNTLLDGLYLYDGGDGYTIVLKSYSGKGQVRSAFNAGNTSSTDEIINGDTGTVIWAGLNGVSWGSTAVQTYMLAGLTDATKLRYGYAATKPTFLWDMSPICGSYTVKNPGNTILDLEIISANVATLYMSASSGNIAARRPLLFPHDTARTTQTVYELVSLTATLRNLATAVIVRVVARSRSTWASTTVVQINSTDPNFVTVTDTLSPPTILDPSAYSYYVEIAVTGASHAGSSWGEFKEVTLNVRKSAVE
jgi:hypothetical protein